MSDPRRQRVAKAFGARVREHRHALGWTLEQLGEHAELHFTYVGVIERGESNVTLYNVVRLAAALGVNPAELVDGLTA
jgi:transcriptional regulator with XRE-family HTH domain